MIERIRAFLQQLGGGGSLPQWIWVLGALFFCAVIVFGSSLLIRPNPQENFIEAMDSTKLAINVLLKLAFVVGLIYASLYLLRRWRVTPPGNFTRQITVLESTRLSQRQALHLVQAGKQVLLIGATDQNLSMLGEIDLLTEEIRSPEYGDHSPAFAKYLWGMLSGRTSSTENRPHADTDIDEIKRPLDEAQIDGLS